VTIQAIVDVGPLLAFLDPRDNNHQAVTEVIGDLPMPLLTVESVLSELSFLLRRDGRPMIGSTLLVSRGMVEIVPILPQHTARIAELMECYAKVPMSFADAALVKLSEIHPSSPVFTLDSDFAIYRRFTRDPLPLISYRGKVREPDSDYDGSIVDPAVTNPPVSLSTESP
jgi:predicted nucleic acid-binding protein